jgi:hypothetical protein
MISIKSRAENIKSLSSAFRITSGFFSFLSVILLVINPSANSFSSQSLKQSRKQQCSTPLILNAKRNKSKGDDDKLNQWYESVNDNATPDEVFWEEMERQRIFNQIGQEGTNDPYVVASSGASSSTASPSQNNLMTGSENKNASPPNTPIATGGISATPPSQTRKPPTMDQQKAADATLSEYALYQVKDNWLDERLQEQMEAMQTAAEQEELSIEEETRRLEEQLEALPDGYGDQRNLLWDIDEPWDDFGSEEQEDLDLDRLGIRQVPEPSPGMYITLSRFSLKFDSNS